MTYFVTWLAGLEAFGTFNATITFVLLTPTATAVATAAEGSRAIATDVPTALRTGVVVTIAAAGGVSAGGVTAGGVSTGGVAAGGACAAEIVNDCSMSVAAA